MDKKGKVSTAVSVLSGISIAVALLRDGKSRFDSLTLYTASVDSDAFVFPSLMEWLNRETKSKMVKFVSKYDGVKTFYDGATAAKINLNGHILSVSLERPEALKLNDGMSFLATDTLVFRSRSREAIDELYRFLGKLTEERKLSQRDFCLYNLASYGWETRSLPYRNLDSIFLDQGVKEDLIDDLDTFFSNEEKYNNIGIPWHRGYLFYGPPGNGKSSLAAAIAHRYKMNLFNLPLSGVKDDKALSENIMRIADNSILLLEDIDIFSKSIGRTQADNGPTLAGLLNALDGVSTPHGLMTFMTTNHIDSLDPALIRPGRIDKRIELTAPTQYQVESMFEFIYGEPLNVEARAFASMAELANVFKKFTTDAESARLEIKL